MINTGGGEKSETKQQRPESVIIARFTSQINSK